MQCGQKKCLLSISAKCEGILAQKGLILKAWQEVQSVQHWALIHPQLTSRQPGKCWQHGAESVPRNELDSRISILRCNALQVCCNRNLKIQLVFYKRRWGRDLDEVLHLQLELQGYRGNQYPTVLGLMALPVLLSSYLECTKPQTWGGANNAIYQEWKNSPPGMHNSWDTPAGDAQIFQTSMLDWIKLLVGTITHWNHLSQVKYHH